MYKHPFKNDPFAAVYTAFRNLYPECDCAILWDNDIVDENGEAVCGVTQFAPGALPDVRITPELSMFDALEILAHELAHVAAGFDAQHSAEWEKAFEAIHREYTRITKEAYPKATMKYKREGAEK